MKFVMYFAYGLAALVALNMLLTLLLLFLSGGWGFLESVGQRNAGLSFRHVVGMIMLVGIVVATHGAPAVFFIYVAETIKIFLDIQCNTQETAFHARNQNRGS